MQCNVTTCNRADMSLSCNTLQQNNNHTASLLYVSVMKECNIFWHGLYIFACSLSNSFGLTKALNCSTSSDVMLTWQFDKHQHLEITPCIPTPQILHSQTASKSFLSCQTAHSTETVSTIQTFIKSCLLPLCHLKNLLEYIQNTSQNFPPKFHARCVKNHDLQGRSSWTRILGIDLSSTNRVILEMSLAKSSWIISKSQTNNSSTNYKSEMIWRQATI